MRLQHKHNKRQYSILRTNDEVKYDVSTLRAGNRFQVLNIKDLTDSTYILQFDRHEVRFVAGQNITLGLLGDNQIREYSVYSPVNKPYFEVLIKEVDEGLVSRKLHRTKVGDILKFDGPFGFFTFDEDKLTQNKFLFIATGTGIAPFHSITGTYSDLNYKILHGVRYANEAYERDHYPNDRYVLCTSRNTKGDFPGRVTDYLSYNAVESGTLVYLCGNCDMIYEIYDLLISGGFNADHIKTEVYF